MIYGMYQSAAGVMASAYRQDVLANNLANLETNGFKRVDAGFQQRLTEAQQKRISRNAPDTNAMLEELGGGLLFSATSLDLSQGEAEQTGNTLDLAIHGKGFFQVDDHGTTRLTRDGRLMVDRAGRLITATNNLPVLDRTGKAITLDPADVSRLSINDAGEMNIAGNVVARLGLVDAAEPQRLSPHGGNLFDYDGRTVASTGTVHSGFVERANVDPAGELSKLMEAQRQLEANANMLRFQDQSLSRLVNDVGKIS